MHHSLCTCHGLALFLSVFLALTQPSLQPAKEPGVISITQMSDLNHREDKYFAKGHRAGALVESLSTNLCPSAAPYSSKWSHSREIILSISHYTKQRPVSHRQDIFKRSAEERILEQLFSQR